MAEQIVFSTHDPKRSEKITLELNSEEAEEILFALVLRSKQKNNSRFHKTIELARKLNSTFETALGWDVFDRVTKMASGIKSVSLKLYDFKP